MVNMVNMVDMVWNMFSQHCSTIIMRDDDPIMKYVEYVSKGFKTTN